MKAVYQRKPDCIACMDLGMEPANFCPKCMELNREVVDILQLASVSSQTRPLSRKRTEHWQPFR
mgnify:CR=1 FL=1